ncbi:MAG TPA: molybdenum cofactor biosynthesis protein B [Xanthomonadales bacterium]|nr:molybdenum cofactor biosynthesis protein B [Xanthomonadales bacterium]
MPGLAEFKPLNIAILTLSDTRTLANDTSGDTLRDLLTAAGHSLADRELCADNVYTMRAIVSRWIADDGIHVVITTGGTGFTHRDSTPEALQPLFDRSIEGFGELFRQHSHEEIGSSTVQSRCCAGLANRTLVFCLPGSTGACRTGWNRILREQLDSRHQPCNFVALTALGGGQH